MKHTISRGLVLCILAVCASLGPGCTKTTPPAAQNDAAGPAATGEDVAGESPTAETAQALAGLSPEDLALAQAQKNCPVSDEPLGVMGTPPKLVVAGRTVFLCCDGCAEAFQSDPEKYLAKLSQ